MTLHQLVKIGKGKVLLKKEKIKYPSLVKWFNYKNIHKFLLNLMLQLYLVKSSSF